jgi:hypothetical protein
MRGAYFGGVPHFGIANFYRLKEGPARRAAAGAGWLNESGEPRDGQSPSPGRASDPHLSDPTLFLLEGRPWSFSRIYLSVAPRSVLQRICPSCVSPYESCVGAGQRYCRLTLDALPG